MKKTYILALVLLSFSLLSCGGNKKSLKNNNNDLAEYNRKLKDMKNLDIQIAYLPQQKSELNISVTITNNTDHDIVLFNDRRLPRIFSVIEDGNTIHAIDVHILTEESETVIKTGTSLHDSYDISTWYYTHKGTHRYEITREPLEEWKSNTIEFDATLTEDGGKRPK